MKRKAIIVLPVVLVLAAGFFLTGHFLKSGGAEKYSITDTQYKCTEYASKTPEEIAASLTLEQKAAQMVMPAVYNIDVKQMRDNDYGCILSQSDHIDAASWRSLVDEYQNAALLSDAGIPYIYGQDDIHGVNYCLNAVYFLITSDRAQPMMRSLRIRSD